MFLILTKKFLIDPLCFYHSSFCGNSQSPLQLEIEEYMQIDDTQFNLMFSVRSIASIIFPFILPKFLEKVGVKYTCLCIVTSCLIGQVLFMVGLEQRNYYFLLLSRFIFGISDSMTIIQQFIMCIWFSNE